MADRTLDVEAARRRIWGYTNASADEAYIATTPALEHLAHDLIVHLWDAIAEVERLRAAVALHQPNDARWDVTCKACIKFWPCPTARTASEEARRG